MLRQSRFGEVGKFVDAGDRGPAMRDVVGASRSCFGDPVGNVGTSIDEPAAGLDGLELLPSPLGQLFGEVFDEPRPGSSTRPTCDSSRSSSWVLRAIRRAKLLAVPGKPPGMATSNGNTSTVSAPPTPAPKAASVVRSMFTQGSRWVIIGSDVSACTTAPPPSGSPTTSATRAHS